MTSSPDGIPPDREEQAAQWFLAITEGELLQEAREEFDLWMADPENARSLERAMWIWNSAGVAAELPEIIQMRSAVLENFRQASQQHRVRSYRIHWRWAAGIAAILAMVILSVALLYQPMQVYRTGIGERRIAVLEDGSKLSLDSDSEVSVRFRNDRRELDLVRGRAKFDVAKDPLRPFAVSIGNKVVVATGTSFSVELLYRQAHVMLYEGHVVVLNRHNAQPVRQKTAAESQPMAADQMLQPGRELVAPIDTMGPAMVLQANPVHSLSWESGQLSFDEEPLQAAMARLNRYSNEKLVAGDQTAANLPVNGVFTAGDTEAFLEALTALHSVKVVRANGKVTITAH